MKNRSRNQHLLCIFATLLLGLPATGIAGVYKWVDDTGQVHYGSEPGNVDAETVTIRNNETTKPRAMKTSDDEANDTATTDGEQEAQAEKKPEKPKQPTISRKEKNRLCKQAKSDVAAISSRGRMREINAKGEYTYLSEPQRQQRLSAAKKRISQYCR